MSPKQAFKMKQHSFQMTLRGEFPEIRWKKSYHTDIILLFFLLHVPLLSMIQHTRFLFEFHSHKLLGIDLISFDHILTGSKYSFSVLFWLEIINSMEKNCDN